MSLQPTPYDRAIEDILAQSTRSGRRPELLDRCLYPLNVFGLVSFPGFD